MRSDTLDLSNISATVPVINLHFRLKDLSQKQQHWLLNLFAFLFKGFVVRAMSYGLAQHGWKALRTTPLTIPRKPNEDLDHSRLLSNLPARGRSRCCAFTQEALRPPVRYTLVELSWFHTLRHHFHGGSLWRDISQWQSNRYPDQRRIFLRLQ